MCKATLLCVPPAKPATHKSLMKAVLRDSQSSLHLCEMTLTCCVQCLWASRWEARVKLWQLGFHRVCMPEPAPKLWRVLVCVRTLLPQQTALSCDTTTKVEAFQGKEAGVRCVLDSPLW